MKQQKMIDSTEIKTEVETPIDGTTTKLVSTITQRRIVVKERGPVTFNFTAGIGGLVYAVDIIPVYGHFELLLLCKDGFFPYVDLQSIYNVNYDAEQRMHTIRFKDDYPHSELAFETACKGTKHEHYLDCGRFDNNLLFRYKWLEQPVEFVLTYHHYNIREGDGFLRFD